MMLTAVPRIQKCKLTGKLVLNTGIHHSFDVRKRAVQGLLTILSGEITSKHHNNPKAALAEIRGLLVDPTILRMLMKNLTSLANECRHMLSNSDQLLQTMEKVSDTHGVLQDILNLFQVIIQLLDRVREATIPLKNYLESFFNEIATNSENGEGRFSTYTTKLIQLLEEIDIILSRTKDKADFLDCLGYILQKEQKMVKKSVMLQKDSTFVGTIRQISTDLCSSNIRLSKLREILDGASIFFDNLYRDVNTIQMFEKAELSAFILGSARNQHVATCASAILDLHRDILHILPAVTHKVAMDEVDFFMAQQVLEFMERNLELMLSSITNLRQINKESAKKSASEMLLVLNSMIPKRLFDGRSHEEPQADFDLVYFLKIALLASDIIERISDETNDNIVLGQLLALLKKYMYHPGILETFPREWKVIVNALAKCSEDYEKESFRLEQFSRIRNIRKTPRSLTMTAKRDLFLLYPQFQKNISSSQAKEILNLPDEDPNDEIPLFYIASILRRTDNMAHCIIREEIENFSDTTHFRLLIAFLFCICDEHTDMKSLRRPLALISNKEGKNNDICTELLLLCLGEHIDKEYENDVYNELLGRLPKSTIMISSFLLLSRNENIRLLGLIKLGKYLGIDKLPRALIDNLEVQREQIKRSNSTSTNGLIYRDRACSILSVISSRHDNDVKLKIIALQRMISSHQEFLDSQVLDLFFAEIDNLDCSFDGQKVYFSLLLEAICISTENSNMILDDQYLGIIFRRLQSSHGDPEVNSLKKVVEIIQRNRVLLLKKSLAQIAQDDENELPAAYSVIWEPLCEKMISSFSDAMLKCEDTGETTSSKQIPEEEREESIDSKTSSNDVARGIRRSETAESEERILIPDIKAIPVDGDMQSRYHSMLACLLIGSTSAPLSLVDEEVVLLLDSLTQYHATNQFFHSTMALLVRSSNSISGTSRFTWSHLITILGKSNVIFTDSLRLGDMGRITGISRFLTGVFKAVVSSLNYTDDEGDDLLFQLRLTGRVYKLYDEMGKIDDNESKELTRSLSLLTSSLLSQLEKETEKNHDTPTFHWLITLSESLILCFSLIQANRITDKELFDSNICNFLNLAQSFIKATDENSVNVKRKAALRLILVAMTCYSICSRNMQIRHRLESIVVYALHCQRSEQISPLKLVAGELCSSLKTSDSYYRVLYISVLAQFPLVWGRDLAESDHMLLHKIFSEEFLDRALARDEAYACHILIFLSHLIGSLAVFFYYINSLISWRNSSSYWRKPSLSAIKYALSTSLTIYSKRER